MRSLILTVVVLCVSPLAWAVHPHRLGAGHESRVPPHRLGEPIPQQPHARHHHHRAR
jgi:hypothetical protein